ncbi:hypothetical protein [Bdellovibrio sp. HCB274]|uniref:hypothetical protein n=1 Tax=Bdellovibrio sp. HCB274 TaxID=3394361 RepID=UPI0039B517ED
MSTFSDEFRKYQKQERRLTGAIVLVSVLAPVSFTLLLDRKFHWLVCGTTALMFLVAAVALHIYRSQVSQKLLAKYETLDVGSVLAKKISPKAPRRFVITNTGYNHFYLRCLNTGEQVLVSKHRVREDFDIAN